LVVDGDYDALYFSADGAADVVFSVKIAGDPAASMAEDEAR